VANAQRANALGTALSTVPAIADDALRHPTGLLRSPTPSFDLPDSQHAGGRLRANWGGSRGSSVYASASESVISSSAPVLRRRDAQTLSAAARGGRVGCRSSGEVGLELARQSRPRARWRPWPEADGGEYPRDIVS